MKTIQSKILFVVITALIVITAIVTGIAVSVTHEIIHRDADRILNNVSQKEAAQINEMLNDFEKSANITQHYTVNALSSVAALRDEAYLSEYIAQIRPLFDEIALNTSGTYSYYLCFSPELTNGTVGFYSQFNDDGSLHELSKEEFSKLSLLTSEELVKYSNLSGVTSGEWIEPHASRFTKEMVVSYVLPMHSNGTFIGILGFNMNFEYLLQRVNAISLYEYGDVLLVSKDSSICYNSSQISDMKGPYTEAATALVNGMSLELRAAYQDIQHDIRPMISNIILAFLLLLVLAILYTVWVTRKIVAPLKKLTAAASVISSGVQEIDLVVDSKDEIGILSRVLSDTYAKILEYSSHIKALAYRDSLTGVKNSTAYTEAIETLNKEINLSNPAFGILVADINNLKKTNDSYGHEVGNDLIIHAARILVETFKASSIYRIGGDEFVVLLKNKDLERYRTLLDKMDAAFEAEYIVVGDEMVSVSIARGLAIFDPMIDHVYTDVFAKADRAMYMNKELMKCMAD